MKDVALNAAKAYAGPGLASAVAIAALHAMPKETEELVKANRPSWAPPDVACYAGAQAAVILPMGCAAALAYERGGGCHNKAVAYGLLAYSASCGLSTIACPAALKKNLKVASASCAGASVAGLAAAGLFGTVEPWLGGMVLPWALAHAAYAYIFAKTEFKVL